MLDDLGYAWQSSEYGLAVDTVVNFELVQPSGDVINVNEATQPELFWALKVSFIHYPSREAL